MLLTSKTAQITSLYGGPLEFLFVLESKDDPAYHAVSRLIAEYKVSWITSEVIHGHDILQFLFIYYKFIG